MSKQDFTLFVVDMLCASLSHALGFEVLATAFVVLAAAAAWFGR